MTEQEWVGCEDPKMMMDHVRKKVTYRKLRLFGVNCCQRIEHLMIEDVRQGVAVAELAADSLASLQALARASHRIRNHVRAFYDDNSAANYATHAAYSVTGSTLTDHSFPEKLLWAHDYSACAMAVSAMRDGMSRDERRRDARRSQAEMFRDIVGNPFRPVTLNPSWLTPTVQQLAAAIYVERRFDRMPFLGDVLEEAGCDNADVLTHCRSGGEHVRGCWVVDLVLGRG